MDAVVGKPAPAFPAGAAWLNGRPLTWADLAGKVVILHVWATWCGPCHNDLPKMVQLHKEREQSGIVVIGVHAAGTPAEEVQKTMNPFGMEYPVCLDVTPGGQGAAAVPLFDAFAVGGIPHAFVVDRRGKVAAHGSLAEAAGHARALAARPADAREPSPR
jgi:thiol-disulfide isomerase/thioredoxin